MGAPKGNQYAVGKPGFGGAQEGAGRPEVPINWELFEELCKINCTQSEIASVLKVHVDTLRQRTVKKYNEEFSVTYKRLTEDGKTSLRRYQFRQAEKNATMAIWLGKQWLGQAETPTELSISPESMNKFTELMTMLQSLQSARKIEETNNSTDIKS